MRRASPSSPVARLLFFALVVGTACRDQADPAPSPASPTTGPKPRSVAGSPCELDALREASAGISERWSSWSPRSGTVPEFSLDAISAVWLHCPGLPSKAKLLLDFAIDHDSVPSLADIARAEGRPAPAVDDDPLEARFPGHASYHGLGKAGRRIALEWRASICPGFTEIETALVETWPEHLEAFWWDRCLHRYDFVTREQYVATIRGIGTVGFALHHWLTESGVDEATADALARPVALGGHLGSRWRMRLPTGMRLPAVAARTEPDGGVMIEVGPRAIRHDERRLATLDDTGALEDELVPEETEPIIGPLFDVLAEVAYRAERLESDDLPWRTTLLLIAHRDIPWSTLRPVLATAKLHDIHHAALLGLVDDPAHPLRFVVIHDGRADAGGTLLELAGATTVQALADAVLAHEGPVRLLP